MKQLLGNMLKIFKSELASRLQLQLQNFLTQVLLQEPGKHVQIHTSEHVCLVLVGEARGGYFTYIVSECISIFQMLNTIGLYCDLCKTTETIGMSASYWSITYSTFRPLAGLKYHYVPKKMNK